jgi:uncharacterized membrane protein YesL
MFGRMMNSFYYGKSGKGDYRKEDLPKNRWQLFKEMLRVRLAGLCRLNLMTVVVWIPVMYILVQLVNGVFSISDIVTAVQKDPAAATPSMLDIAGNQAQYLYNLLFMTLLWMIPAITITGPVSAGMAYITRNWARDEHAFVWSDFKDAVKANWKQSLLVSFITSLMPIVLFVCYRFYGEMVAQSVFYIVPQMLTLTMGGVWALGLMFMYPMIITYKMKAGQMIKDSLLLAVARLPQAVGIRLLALLPAGIAVLVALYTPASIYALMALAGYYLIIGHGLSRFIFASFTNAVFDKYLNQNIPGVTVNRGMSKDDEDEDIGEEDAQP